MRSDLRFTAISLCMTTLLITLLTHTPYAGAQATAPQPVTAPQAAPPPRATPAARPASSSRVWPPHRAREKGLLASLGFGISGCNDNWCDDFDPLVYLRAHVLYRVLNYVAFGLQIGLPFHDANDRYVDARYDVFMGPEVRGILPLGRFEVWSGLGMGWMRAQADGEGCLGGVCREGSSWSDGLGIAWGFGGLYYVTPRIGLGLDFWLYKPIFFEGCIDIEGYDKDCGDIEEEDRDDVGITWMLGASAVFFLPM
jgi:hypothetical protein